MKRYGFTLAEILITLAIIGVVAALTIPSVISNTQQQEFKTGFKKAVSVLNSAITTSIALDGESPYDNKDTFNYLIRHMSIMKTTFQLPWRAQYYASDGSTYQTGRNGAFYTTDGMRFEFDDYRVSTQSVNGLRLHDSNIQACVPSIITDENYKPESTYGDNAYVVLCGGCGSLGLKNNPNNTTKPPCAILVDVNGDKKPTPQDALSVTYQKYWVPDLGAKRVSDIFTILITEDRAIPYGVVAQKAMYQSQR